MAEEGRHGTREEEDHNLVHDVELADLNDDLVKFLQDEGVRDDLLKGVDLQQYSRDIDSQLRQAEEEAVYDYIQEAERLATLHEQIKSFDTVLEGMQKMLSGFQSHLGNISSEMKYLQDQSLAMNNKLKNRKEVRDKLNGFIDAVSLPPEFIRGICEKDLNETYVDYLVLLTKKKQYINQYPTSKSAIEAGPALKDLTQQSVLRIRDFLHEHIYSLQTPKTNIQIKQGVLSKYKHFIEFLETHDSRVAQEVRSNYVEIMGKIYTSVFRKYIADILLLVKKDKVPDNRDLIGCEIQKAVAGLFSSFAGPKKTESHLIEVLSLGNRLRVFKDMEEEVRYHVAMKNGEKLFFEEAFAAISRNLMNSTISEYLFITDFFGRKNSQMFLDIFHKTFSFFLEQLEDFLFGCSDVLSVLLMLRILYQNQLVMLAKKVSCLEQLFERTNSLLWPKFKLLIDAHIDSVRKLNISSSQIQESSVLNVYFVSRRYAEVSVALTILNKEYNDEIVSNALTNLRKEIEALYKRSAIYIEKPKEQVIFLISLLDIISRVYQNRGVSSEDLTILENLQKTHISSYVDEELQSAPAFNKMVSLIKSMESLAGSDAKIRVDEGRLRIIVKEFKDGWKEGIEQINEQVQFNFSEKWSKAIRSSESKEDSASDIFVAVNVPPAASNIDSPGSHPEIMKLILTSLVNYYQRFQALLSKMDAPPAIQRELVSRQTLLYEIKKYHKGGR